MFKHPKYYKELRKAGNELAKRNAVKEDLACSGSSLARNNLDQTISLTLADGCNGSVRSGPGLKLRHGGLTPEASGSKQQAPSLKLQASQATSHKLQAPSIKVQASSRKLQAPRLLTLEKVSRHPNRGAQA